MSQLKNSWIYRRAGLPGLRTFQFAWFALVYAVLGISALSSIFMPPSIRAICIVLCIVATGLVTKMLVGFSAELRELMMEESISDDTAKGSRH